jgi:N-acetyl sugar amidotransferase
MTAANLKRCTRCLLPETYETIIFDGDGVCNICRQTEFKVSGINWEERGKKLGEIIEKYRGKSDYDCIIPFSGGKDSTFQLLYLMKTYKIKPLIVRFVHGFMRPVIASNNTKTFKKLGVDVLDFTPNWHIVKRVMKEAFIRKTDFCWHCHTGIYSYPLRVSLKFNIPLVIWGETQSEVTAYYTYTDNEIEVEDEKRFNKIRNLGISADDMFNMINSPSAPIDRRDLIPYTYPSLKELRAIDSYSIALGSFIPWDYTANTKMIQEELGWESDEIEGVPRCVNTHCEKIECFMQGPRDYVKYLKRGYSRVSQLSAFQLRQGRTTLEEAKKNIAIEGGRPPALDIFLEYMGLTEEEFYEIVRATEVYPHKHDYSQQKTASKTWDFDQWYREDNRPGAV